MLHTDPGITAYTHTLTDSAFNGLTFHYRYTVRDTAGATAEATKDIKPTAYVAPSIAIILGGATLTSPESALSREKGNVGSTMSATITRNSQYVSITSWQWQYQENGAGAYTNIGTTGPGTSNPIPVSTGVTAHSTAIGITSAVYRLKVTDTYQDSISSSVTANSSQINYLNYIFYGPTGSAPTTSSNVRSLPNRQFTTTLANPFEFLTGTVHKDFTVALPSPRTVTALTDIESSNASILGGLGYNLSAGLTGIQDFAGITTAYNVYIFSPAVAYTDAAHTHLVTRNIL